MLLYVDMVFSFRPSCCQGQIFYSLNLRGPTLKVQNFQFDSFFLN